MKIILFANINFQFFVANLKLQSLSSQIRGTIFKKTTGTLVHSLFFAINILFDFIFVFCRPKRFFLLCFVNEYSIENNCLNFRGRKLMPIRFNSCSLLDNSSSFLRTSSIPHWTLKNHKKLFNKANILEMKDVQKWGSDGRDLGWMISL